ncbi:ricin-type beta-trefoil lectin domain protein [Streptomyces sp. NPDC093085]|uniref:ricin-type beta-trefoil lectin domain protein n=1 Tax=Streptomyces sp. NPDC093085 TaxID=3155068 RepID=UPI003435C52C
MGNSDVRGKPGVRGRPRVRGNPRRPLWAVSLLALCAALGTLAAPPPDPRGENCERLLVGVAHQDDDLLFVNPEIQRTVRAGCPVRTVYLTAGDAGHPFAKSYYVKSREDGIRAAYAKMAGTKDTWSRDDTVRAGRRLLSYALTERPDIRLTFLRLPDGLPRGGGTTTYHHQSLLRLFRGDITTLRPVDGTRPYTESALLATLTRLIEGERTVGKRTVRKETGRERAVHVRTLDYDNSSFGQRGSRTAGHSDHSDHAVAARYFRKAAHAATDPPPVTPYLGYTLSLLPANLTPEQTAEKGAVFAAYYRHTGCVPRECPAVLPYGGGYRNWVHKEYRRTSRAPRPGEIMSAIATTRAARTVELCLTARGNTAATAPCAGTRAQSWTYTGGTLRPAAGGRCLTAPYGGTAAPALAPCDGSPAQRWTHDPRGRFAAAGACLAQDDLLTRHPRLHLARCTPYRPEVRWTRTGPNHPEARTGPAPRPVPPATVGRAPARNTPSGDMTARDRAVRDMAARDMAVRGREAGGRTG